MIIISHRGYWLKKSEQNSLIAFKRAFIHGFGAELDARDHDSQIVISHNPPSKNKLVYLNDLFDLFKNNSKMDQTLAINIKADGIANAIRDLVKQYDILNYFTFDMSIPEMARYKSGGIKYFTRISDYEQVPVLIDNAAGIWLDAFEGNWYTEDDLNGFKENNKTVCIVSSELHGRDYRKQWDLIKKLSENGNIMLCTDTPIEAKIYFNR